MTGRHAIPLAVLAALAVSGCAGSRSDKAGGPRDQKPIVLTMANEFAGTDELGPFLGAVNHISGGTIHIKLRNAWRLGETHFEDGVIDDVRRGKVDLAWTGSRAWESAGVTSLRALHAPFLIDSFALQERVIGSQLVREMLRGLEPLGLVGLGVLPGPLRRPFAIARPLLGPADYRGLRFGVQQSRLADTTMRALGARPDWFPVRGAIRRFDAIEQQLPAIYGNGYGTKGTHVTANVALWPRPLVIFANKRAFDSLSTEQQTMLRHAIAFVNHEQTARERAAELQAAQSLCRLGVTFDTASAADLAALRRAVQPVYHELERDAQTKRFIQAIAAMRSKVEPAPPFRCRSARQVAPASAAGPLDGVYRWTVTKARDVKVEGHAVAENYGTFTVVIARGRFAQTQESDRACTWAYGIATVKGRTLEQRFTAGGGVAPNNANNKPGEVFTWRWSLYRETLRIAPIVPGDLFANTWRRISTTPSTRSFSRRCPPPAGALGAVR
jgi:TRAP-type C4-dicarboxylate transport system substrate-binding protein